MAKRCAYCGKDESEVARLIDGPGTQICNECIVLLYGMLTEAEKVEMEPITGEPPLPPE